ncbi:uncharacterized protein METZ01_LOCUS414410 [marine metagenome]|uniref:Uncharacterized protein n=1 Tax=marine metagenome TaxID=408172 RepID=A0A382WRT9_9ZZZZ
MIQNEDPHKLESGYHEQDIFVKCNLQTDSRCQPQEMITVLVPDIKIG